MIVRLVAALIAMIAVVVPASAQTESATGPVALAATSQWNVDYGENECRLLRQFGSGDQMVVLRIAKTVSFDNYDVIIAGASIPQLSLYPSVSLRVDDGAPITTPGYSERLPSLNARFVRIFDVDAERMARIVNSGNMTVTSGSFSVAFNLRNLPAALAALQTCQDSLLLRHGFDVAAHRMLRSPPTASNDAATWVTPADYPRTDASGITALILQVGADGLVTDCRVIVPSGNGQLDRAACRAIIRRARYNPAIDANGNAVGSQDALRIRWHTWQSSRF
jgi:TonB family protein